MSDEKFQFFIDVVGDFIDLKTPYSTGVYHYDNIDWLCDDIKYCLECEVKKHGKKNEKVTRSQNI